MTKLNLHKTSVLAILVLVALASVNPAIQPAFAHSAEVPISVPSFNVEIDAIKEKMRIKNFLSYYTKKLRISH